MQLRQLDLLEIQSTGGLQGEPDITLRTPDPYRIVSGKMI